MQQTKTTEVQLVDNQQRIVPGKYEENIFYRLEGDSGQQQWITDKLWSQKISPMHSTGLQRAYRKHDTRQSQFLAFIC